MQFFKPENWLTVREALIQAGRQDLIGGGCDCLIPAQPPKEAIEVRRRRANEAARDDHYHSVANPAKGEPAGERGLPNRGYRPGRKTAGRHTIHASRRAAVPAHAFRQQLGGRTGSVHPPRRSSAGFTHSHRLEECESTPAAQNRRTTWPRKRRRLQSPHLLTGEPQ
jgi:hypothetical protein